MHVYDTVSEALKDLKGRGYNNDFNLAENCIICNNEKFEPLDFEIVEVYRFEGDSDPADEAIVYAIQSKTGVKGVLVNGYGIYSETISDELAKKINTFKI